jgi:hypothetical protein
LARRRSALKPIRRAGDFRQVMRVTPGICRRQRATRKLPATHRPGTPMTSYEIVARLHGLIGAVALASFWFTAATRKGSPLHVRSGRVYLGAMGVLLLLAVPLCADRMLAGQPIGWFLGYVLLLTATACWTAWRSIRFKREFARYAGSGYAAVAMLNAGAGMAMFVAGLLLGRSLFMIFAAVGVLGGLGMLRLRRLGPADARWWLREHIAGMTANAVATHIAFLSIGLPALLPRLSGPVLQQLAWLGPLAVALGARLWIGRRYLGGGAPRQPAGQAATGR